MKILTGWHAIEEALKSRTIRADGAVLYVSRAGKRIETLVKTAEAAGVEVRRCSPDELAGKSGGKAERGVLLIYAPDNARRSGFRNLSPSLDEALASVSRENSLIIVLDGITDTRNFGAIIRSADLFEADFILTSERRAAQKTDAVSKTASGADNYLPVCRVTNLGRALERLKEEGYWIYGAEMGGTPLPEAELCGRVALVMGREGEGLHKLTEKKCDVLLSIPTAGHVDSFNVAVAAGILMYEIRRQQRA